MSGSTTSRALLCGGLVLMLFVLGACGGGGPRVHSDHRSDWDFSAIETVALMPWEPDAQLLLRMDPLYIQRQRSAALAALRAAGYQETAPTEADVLISVLVRTEHDLTLIPLRSHHDPFPGDWWDDRLDRRHLHQVPVQRRTLLVDLIDRTSRAVIWRGSARIRGDATAGAALAAQVLARFPPATPAVR